MKRITLLFILVISVLVSGCKGQNNVPTVRLGHAPHDHHAPLYIAAVKGDYFKDHGGVYLKQISYKHSYQLIKNDKLIANIEIDSSTGGIHLIRKLDERILDVSFGGVPAIISMIDKGSKIKIIAPVMSEGAALVVNKNIPVSNWEEFIEFIKNSKTPVRIGYKVDYSVQNLIFEAALGYENISFSRDLSAENVKVIVINLHGPKNLLPSLKAGVIDGFVVMQPYPAIAEDSGEAKIITHLNTLPPKGKWNGYPCCALAAGEDYINKHEDIVAALVELFRKAGIFIEEHPDESAKITAEWLVTSKSVEDKSLPTINFLNEYNKEWDAGINFWIKSLIDRNELNGALRKSYEEDNVNEILYDNRFYDKIKK